MFEFGPIKLTNTVSGVVLSILLILVAGLVWLLNGVYKTRTEARVGREQAEIAATKAQDAASNTQNVSNGFAGKVNHKLDDLLERTAQNTRTLDDVQRQLTDHLLWHQQNEGKHHG